MGRLNQTIAVEKGVKVRTHQHLTEAYQKLQKTPLLQGQIRTYQPLHEEGQVLPSEIQRVQLRTSEVIDSTIERLTELFDVTAAKDYANCSAVADVVIDGVTLLKGVPATYLLFLEKQLVDLHTFVSKLPTLDPSESWSLNANTNEYQSEPAQTLRTQKVPHNHVKAEATREHPAQIEIFFEDIPVGRWTTTKSSGAFPATRVMELTERVQKLQKAVKIAREEANMTESPSINIGEKFFGYVFS